MQLVLGTWLLYSLLGVSCFAGLAATLVCLPLQHFTGKIIIRTQSALMRAKDERIGLTNEVGSNTFNIRFTFFIDFHCIGSRWDSDDQGKRHSPLRKLNSGVQFMAWERTFEARLWGIRKQELHRQKITYTMKVSIYLMCVYWQFGNPEINNFLDHTRGRWVRRHSIDSFILH
jgi:hypothetical protein